MAERAGTAVVSEDKVCTVRWTGLTNGDTGAPVRVARYPAKTVQVTGTFGTGGDVDLQGSNVDEPSTDDSDWGQLGDQTGTFISIGDLLPLEVAENPLWIRPKVAAGDGDTLLVCTIICTVRGV